MVLFGTLFSNIVIIRTDPTANNAQQIIKVPIEYAPKEKMLTRVLADPDIDRPYSLLLPRMSFETRGYRYDGSRKLPTVNRIAKKIIGDNNKLQFQYMPVPWNIDFNLYVYVKNTEDGLKVVEQILPFFTPVWTSTLILVPEMDVTMDIPITIGSPSVEDQYSGDFKTRKILIWTIPFTLKGYLYGPITQIGIIKIANTSFYIANTTPIQDSVGHVEIGERIIITPGVDANGHPVNYDGPRPANTTSIALPDITADSDFGYIETTESVPVGVPRPIAGANVASTATETAIEETVGDPDVSEEVEEEHPGG